MLSGPNDAAGQVLNGEWKLLRLIGEGGLATVYEAESTRGLGRRAIKLLQPQFAGHANILERFEAEAEACKGLSHPHIAEVESFAYTPDGTPYIVMELLPGVALGDYLRQERVMRPAEAAPIIYGVLQALIAAHAAGVVHRDLKPANLFLVPAGSGRFTVKVLDFGIAKVLDAAGGVGTRTRTGAVLGTPGYMSPEQVRNSKAVDARTDLWAAGTVLYEMLTGHHPFGEGDPMSRILAVLREPARPIAQLRPELASWQPFFDRALARDLNTRFQSAHEMAVSLMQHASGSAVHFAAEGAQTAQLPMMPDMRAQPVASAAAGVDSAIQEERPHTLAEAGIAAGIAAGAAAGRAAMPAVSPAVWSQHAPSPQLAHARTLGAVEGSYPPPPSPDRLSSVPAMASSYPPPAAVQLRTSRMPAVATGSVAPGATQVSREAYQPAPVYRSEVPPPIAVEMARRHDGPTLVWWAVVLVAALTFGLGMAIGAQLG